MRPNTEFGHWYHLAWAKKGSKPFFEPGVYGLSGGGNSSNPIDTIREYLIQITGQRKEIWVKRGFFENDYDMNKMQLK